MVSFADSTNMNVLFLSRSNTNSPHPFIKEQADIISNSYNVRINHFLIASGGISGYSKAVFKLFKYIQKNKVDIIHVHYGLWGFVAVLNKYVFFRNNKIVITFHGSDINKKSERKMSLLAAYFSSHNILVSEKMTKYFKRNYSLIPCGIDTDVQLQYRESFRKEMSWTENDFIVLFSSSFDRKEKDPEFAFNVIDTLTQTITRPVKFVELKGYNRQQVTGLMQAADALLMCSIREGSPQVIKEAILNTLPIVSNDVGDVELICSGIDNCYILGKSVPEYVKCLYQLSQTKERIQNREPVIMKFDNNTIAKKIYTVYCTTLNRS